MSEQHRRALRFLHAQELAAANRIGEWERLVREQDRLASVHLQLVDVRALRELEVPPILRRRPAAEAAAAGRVRLLVAGPEEARQGRIGRPGQQPAVAQEAMRLVDGSERPVGDQPAEVGPPFVELLHARIQTGLPPVFPAQPSTSPPFFNGKEPKTWVSESVLSLWRQVPS